MESCGVFACRVTRRPNLATHGRGGGGRGGHPYLRWLFRREDASLCTPTFSGCASYAMKATWVGGNYSEVINRR